MAKLFYSLDEAAEKLRMSQDEVRNLVTTGQLQEFRDRDRLMFKVDQVNLMAGGGDDDGLIPLAESGEADAISLVSDSGTGINLESPKEQTGISIFEAEGTEEADPSAVTQVTESAPTELSLETVGSGSGLMDLTREADDTSLGADLLEDIYGNKGTGAGETAAETAADGGQLFESTGAETDVGTVTVATPAMMAAMAEPYDGGGSGLAGGLAFGMVLTLGVAMTLTLAGITGQTGFRLAETLGQNWMMWVGILAGVTLLAGVIGWWLGKRT